MKNLFILVIFLSVINVFAQNKVGAEKIVDAEKAFAKTAEEKGVKAAFLEYLADDGIIFRPTAINGKESFRSRPDTPALLSWHPAFADISSNGVLGYSTGPGEFRPKGKTDANVYYSEYATVWRRQADGSYKAALDIGISHEKPENDDKNWASPKTIEKVVEENKPISANAMSSFFDVATTKSLEKAYKNFAAEDVRFLRDGKFPIIGKNNAVAEVKTNSKITFGKNVTMQSAGDLAYSVTTYEMKNGEKTTEKGNIVQIWKLIGGKWQIVLDVFAPIPEK
jgi:ketosteroid isomerase-like protein